MKKLLPIGVVLVLLLPSVTFSSFVIELKNDSTFTTSGYWEEGNEIVFYQYEGVVRIAKDLVREVTLTSPPVDRPPQPIRRSPGSVEAETQAVASAPAKQEEPPPTEARPPGEKAPAPDLADYRQMKVKLEEDLELAESKHRQALKNADKVARRKASREIWEIEKQRVALAKEIKEKNNGVLPKWWQRHGGEEEADDGSLP